MLVAAVSSIPDGFWTFAAAFITGFFGLLLGCLKYLDNVQKDRKELTDKILNEVVPLIGEAREGLRSSTAVVKEVTVLLAVQQAEREYENRQRQPPNRRS